MNYLFSGLIIAIIISVASATPFFAYAQEMIVQDIVFPVDGEYTLSDTFGAPRSGGRTHEGIDIMADKMTPVVAVVDGRVTYLTETEQSWGYAIYIEDTNGYSYRYLHLNNDTPGTDDGEGGRAYAIAPELERGSVVSAGQLLGWIGDSGNAEVTGSHLHFEMLTPSKTVVNAYPSLINAIASGTPSSSYKFTRDLEYGDTGNDVKELQKYLNTVGYVISESGAGSPGNETEYFGSATQAALIKFQQDHHITPAVGYFGPLTRDVVNRVAVAPPTSVSPPSSVPGIQSGDLVKNLKFVEVFYVDEQMQLRWVVNEAAAEKHFGSTWNHDIKEFDDLNIYNLSFGDNLN